MRGREVFIGAVLVPTVAWIAPGVRNGTFSDAAFPLLNIVAIATSAGCAVAGRRSLDREGSP